MEIKVSRRWRWWSWRCLGGGDQRHKMMMAISYHLYWLHVMFIFYASYLALIDGSILRWSLTNYQEVFSLSMHRCESSSCWDTTWWSGVIGSTFKYNGCKTVAHAEYSGYTWRAKHIQIWPRNTETERSSVNHIVDMINIVMFPLTVHRCEGSLFRSTTWWSGVIDSNVRIQRVLTSLACTDMASEHGRPKGRAWVV